MSQYTDLNGNVYNSVIIGPQEWIIENLKTTKYADGSDIAQSVGDWFLPSSIALSTMRSELYLYSVGGFLSDVYWSSTEANASNGNTVNFSNGVGGIKPKSETWNIRAIRSFISTDVLSLRGLGQCGGLIFHIDDNGDGSYTYWEAAPSDQTAGVWSNVGSTYLGTTSGFITESLNNTDEIIAQVGHTNSAAKTCKDLSGNAFVDGSYSWYNNDIANKADYGALYTWGAVEKGLVYLKEGSVKSEGWRVTTKADWDTLIDAVGGVNLGGTLKETGTTHWQSPNTGAADSAGIAIRPSGYKLTDGSFSSLTYYASHWMNTEAPAPWTATYAYCTLFEYNSVVYDPNYYDEKIKGFAVKAVRDVITVKGNNGNYPTYRFYVSMASSLSFEVFPLNFNDTSLNDSQEKGQIFYRRKFNGTLTFGSNSKVTDVNGIVQNRKDDWIYFWDIEQSNSCEPLYLTITKTKSGVVSTYCECRFSTSDGEFDIDKCIFSVNPTIIDDYNDILSISDNEHNILDPVLGVTPAVTTRAIQTPIDVTFDRNRWLIDVIEYLAQRIVPECTLSSTFFTAVNNPVTLTTNYLTLLTIAKKVDIIRPADPAVTTALMSWNQLMDILWGMFQVKWDYDSLTNTINVEHISWWIPTAGEDLRTQLLSVATNKYVYLKEKMPKYEKFSFMEAEDLNFVGTPIWYDSHCVNQDIDSNTNETKVNITTDLNYIITTPDAISDSGFVILCNYLDGAAYKVRLEVGSYMPTTLLNMHLSIANLQNYYFRHNRVLIEGYLNGVYTTFWTAIKTKNQSCGAIICDDFDASEEITTQLGEDYLGGVKGKVQSSELKPTGEVKLSLLYGPEDNVPTPISPVTKGIHLTEEARTHAHWGHFFATLSEAAPLGGLVVKVTGRVLDEDGHVLCSGVQQTWTINAGLTTADFEITECGSISEHLGCPDFVWDLTSATLTGWEVDIEYDINYSCQ